LVVRFIRSTYLAIRQRMAGHSQSVLDPVGFADHREPDWPGVDGVSVPRLLGELDAVVVEVGVDLVGHGLKQVLYELSGRLSASRCSELSDCELGGPVGSDEQEEFPLGRLNF
jgi:hypothetical protein